MPDVQKIIDEDSYRGDDRATYFHPSGPKSRTVADGPTIPLSTVSGVRVNDDQSSIDGGSY